MRGFSLLTPVGSEAISELARRKEYGEPYVREPTTDGTDVYRRPDGSIAPKDINALRLMVIEGRTPQIRAIIVRKGEGTIIGEVKADFSSMGYASMLAAGAAGSMAGWLAGSFKTPTKQNRSPALNGALGGGLMAAGAVMLIQPDRVKASVERLLEDAPADR